MVIICKNEKENEMIQRQNMVKKVYGIRYRAKK